VFIALVIFSLYISIKDWQSQKITNRSLLCGLSVFATFELLTDSNFFFVSLLFCLAVSPVLLFAGVGAGDIKLLALFSMFYLPSTLITLQRFLSAISALSIVLIFITFLRSKPLAASIAFGPAICGAVIWCAR